MKQNRKISKLLWERWQLELIRDLAGKVTLQELASKVKRTPLATQHKANLHGYNVSHPDNEAL